jgi:hypothetical protein
MAIESPLPSGVIGKGWPGGEVGDFSCTGQFANALFSPFTFSSARWTGDQ